MNVNKQRDNQSISPTYEVLRTKSVDIRHTCFTFFDRTPFLIGVELQAFDRICALARIKLKLKKRVPEKTLTYKVLVPVRRYTFVFA